jgi:hypothetical protein
MSRAGVLGSLLQHLLFGLAASHEITVSYHVIAMHYLGHKKPSFMQLGGKYTTVLNRIALQSATVDEYGRTVYGGCYFLKPAR